MKKSYTNLHDFINDTSFVNWVKKEKLSDESFWDFWIANNPSKKELVNDAKDIVLGIQFKAPKINQKKIELEWQKLEATILKSNQSKKAIIKKKNINWIGYAASILLLFSISIYTINKDKIITHKTDFGETLSLKLNDGSKVILNANSSISYAENNNRKVTLKGEAFFIIEKKPTTNAKFWVATNDLDIEVYGTVFNVNSKKEKTQVFLEEGSISLLLANNVIKKMSPGNYLSYTLKNNTILENTLNGNKKVLTSWKDGKLFFDNITLVEAMEKVTETYGYNVVFSNSQLKTTLITGTVPTTNIDICLQAIMKSVGINIKKENNTLIIKNK